MPVYAPLTDASRGRQSVPLLLRTILRARGFKVLMAGSWLGYWLLYMVSGGMFFYYSFDILPLLQKYQVPNPSFLNYFSGLLGLYNSGMIWFPNGHLQVNIVYGPFVFSLILATLFSLNMVLTVFGLRLSHVARRTGPVGLLALVPALFSGGCCSVPVGLALVGVFAPAAGLFTLVYDYSYLVNLAFAILMVLVLLYVGRKVARASSGKS